MTGDMSEPDAAAGLDLWQRIARPGTAVNAAPAVDPAMVQSLARRVTAATVAVLVPGAEPAPGDVRQSQLLNRFRHAAGRKWFAALAETGLPVLAIKGLANATWLYREAQDRGISDADLLVQPQDLSRAVDLLRGHGFRFADEPTRSRWGFVSEASFQPLLSPDGAVNIDLHVAGDAAPFATALPTAEMLGQAQHRDGLAIPSPTHAFMLSASHAARDLFTADAAKTVIDGLLMLRRAGDIDWQEVAARCRAGGMLRPVTVFVALLGRLGADISPAAAVLPVQRVGGWCFERVVQDHCRMFPAETGPGTAERLARQWSLAASPGVALRRDLRRLTGLFRPHSGLPDQP